MTSSKDRGNNPELWQRLLDTLDDKLQLGLLDHLKRVASYHFEEDILYIEPGNPEDAQYLNRPGVFQQLQIYAKHSIKAERVKIK